MKYENQNPIEKLHDGEPYFFIRGKDTYARRAVMRYADMLRDHGDFAGAKEVESIALAMLQWQAAHPELVKHPD